MPLHSIKNPLTSGELQTHISGSPLRYSGFFMPVILGWPGVISLIFLRILGRCGVPVRITGLTYVVFEAPSRLYSNFKKNIRTMNTVDVSSYLVEVYLQSEQISDHQFLSYELSNYLNAIEQWWERQKEVGEPLSTSSTYLMLAQLNMLNGYVLLSFQDGIPEGFKLRLFRLKAELVARFGAANDLVEDFVHNRLAMDEELDIED